MKIIIVGDGKVGDALAEQLAREQHDIVVVDKSEAALRRAAERMDVLTVRGNGMSGAVLLEAGVEDCDLVIAATSRDEMNMVCCLTAKKLGARCTVARIRDPEYARDVSLLKRELEIDMVINPEQATAAEIFRLLRFPGAVNIEPFVRGRVEMVGFVAEEGDAILGTPLRFLRKRVGADILFCAYERDDEAFIPNGTTEFQAGDCIYAIGEGERITSFFKTLGRDTARVRDAVIIGGGRIARYLARHLIKSGVRVKIFEIDEDAARDLAEMLPEAVILHADGTDMEVLESENFAGAHAVVTLTDRDEDNIMVALYALQRGVERVVAKSNRQNYEPVVRELGLNCLVSPKIITANEIVHLVRGMQNSEGSVMETLYRIVDGKAEAAEFTVSAGTPHLGVPLKKLSLRKNIIIAVIVRDGRIIIPCGDDMILQGDSVILLTSGMTLTKLSDVFAEGSSV